MIGGVLSRRATRAKVRPLVAKPTSLVSPVGGWNARDPLPNMKPEDAIIMDDWFPTSADVMLRKGWTNHATNISGQVDSVMAYVSGTSSKLFAAAGSSIFDATNSGNVGVAAVSGLSNARWQHVQFTNSAGTAYLYAVNGADKPLLYDGSSWVAVDGVSTPAITGVTTTNLVHLTHWKRRVWFVEKNTMKAWYLPVDSIGGAAAVFNLGPLMKFGGSLQAIATWTIDAGEGMDDHLCFISTEGEVAVYKGTDPASATTFALVGVYRIGRPIGRRCFVKYGGDLIVLCKDGLVPMSQALLSDRSRPQTLITDKIRSAFTAAFDLYAGNFGWQPFYFPAQNMLWINVPTTEGATQHQYVSNTITKAWSRFTGYSANCWELFGDNAYFGGNGFVGRAWHTNADNSANISGSVKQAFSYYGARGVNKRWTMMRPILSIGGSPAILAGINVDYEDAEILGTLTPGVSGAGVWGTSVWGSFVWGGGLRILKNWLTVTGIGSCASVRLRVSSQTGEVRWSATDVVYEPGGIL